MGLWLSESRDCQSKVVSGSILLEADDDKGQPGLRSWWEEHLGHRLALAVANSYVNTLMATGQSVDGAWSHFLLRMVISGLVSPVITWGL